MFRIKYTKASSSSTIISRGCQIILVLNGSAIVNFKNFKLSLNKGQLFYIPRLVAYQLEVDLEYDALKIYLPEECDEQLREWSNQFININYKQNHQLLAHLLKEYQDNPSFDSSVACMQLLKNFKYQKKGIDIIYIQDTRVTAVCDYIQQNFERRITASDVAEQIGMNAAYLTTLFKREVGIPITKYINYIRLEAALNEIYYTQYSFTRIAFSNGFADVRTFNNLIKQRYGMAPSEMRATINHDVYKYNKYIIVEEYIEQYYLKQERENGINTLCIDVDNKNGLKQLVNNNFNSFAIGRAVDILDADVQSQIIEASGELTFKYCRFHNIFGDEMDCINYWEGNLVEFGFSTVFKVFDFLLANNIKPFVELGFFPSQICNQVEGPFTGYRINVGGEINYQLWVQLLKNFGRELIARYGQTEISSWRFEVFNEPDLEAFWANPIKEYIKLYDLTYNTLKAVNHAFTIGGFGVSNFNLSNQAVFELNQAVFNKDVKLDFLSIHSYPFAVFDFVDYRKLLSNHDVNLEYSFDKLRTDLEQAITYAKDIGVDEVYITEWNTTVHHRESLNDDLYKASAIIREFIRIADLKINGISYWTLSDVVYELGLPAEEFHGGMGLITKSGLKKPGYLGMVLANQIKGQILKQSTNYLVTATKDKIYILIHNNANLKRDYGNKMGSDVTKQVDTQPINIKINLYNLNSGIYNIKTTFLTEEINPKTYSNYRGLNRYLKPEDIIQIKENCKVVTTKVTKQINSTYSNSVLIQNNEVVLVVLEKITKN